MKSAKLKLRHTRKRVYKLDFKKNKFVIFAPAEHAIFRGANLLARIVKNGDGWRACVPGETSKIGNAISPVGLNKFKAVRDWSFEYFSEKESQL